MNADYWIDGPKAAYLMWERGRWCLGIVLNPRITNDIYDVTVLWNEMFTPTINEARLKAKEILDREWK